MQADGAGGRDGGMIRDLALATLLAVVLVLCWTLNDWPQVARLNLPDTDDMMRLAQVRDWLNGQAFNDWSQHRLAPPIGAQMHWSRINDFGIAASILFARPLLGPHGAEVFAVIAYPGLLFLVYLLLSGRIARRLGGSAAAPIAIVLASIAYPAVSLFIPGRIDHHALQIVLTLATVLALMRPPSIPSGVVAGLTVTLSLTIGLETAPQVAAIMAVLFGLWVWRGAAESKRAIAFGATVFLGTAFLLGVARPIYWSPAWCDTFTPASTTAMLAAGLLWMLFGAAATRVTDWRIRLVAGGLVGGGTLTAVIAAYPVCLTGPYGPMDPLVRRAFVDNIVEARGVFEQSLLDMGIPTIGLMIAASLVAIWFVRRQPERAIAAAPLIAVLAISDLVVLAQVRGAYIGAAACAPLLAQLVLAARTARFRLPAVLGAWAVSAGILYLMIPHRLEAMMEPRAQAHFRLHQACQTGDVWQQIDAFPAGVVMAPMDKGAYLIGGTHHGVVAAGYHRNNRGNRAAYDFFLSDPARALAIARAWRVDYVVLCPTDFGELDPARAYPGSLATRMLAGSPPPWLTRLPLHGTALQLYRLPR